jgi:hypothetical protein
MYKHKRLPRNHETQKQHLLFYSETSHDELTRRRHVDDVIGRRVNRPDVLENKENKVGRCAHSSYEMTKEK